MSIIPIVPILTVLPRANPLLSLDLFTPPSLCDCIDSCDAARRPRRATNRALLCLPFSSLLAILLCGCTPWRDYIHNGFKVGPNYCRPAAPVANQWIDANDLRVKSDEQEPCEWWTVFN